MPFQISNLSLIACRGERPFDIRVRFFGFWINEYEFIGLFLVTSCNNHLIKNGVI